MNTSELLFSCRNSKTVSKLERDVTPGQVWKLPVYCPNGIRHRSGMISIRGLMWNCRNLQKGCSWEKLKRRSRKAYSTDALCRGGTIRSSDEAFVMKAERRDRVIQWDLNANHDCGRSI